MLWEVLQFSYFWKFQRKKTKEPGHEPAKTAKIAVPSKKSFIKSTNFLSAFQATYFWGRAKKSLRWREANFSPIMYTYDLSCKCITY